MRLLYWLLMIGLSMIGAACQQTGPAQAPDTVATTTDHTQAIAIATQEQDVQTIESIQAYVAQKRMEKGQWIQTEVDPSIKLIHDKEENGQLVRQTATMNETAIEVYWRPNASGQSEVCYVQLNYPDTYYRFYNLSPTGYSSKVVIMDQEGAVLMGGKEGELLRQYEAILQTIHTK